jgi:hypothetical protein
MHDDLGLIIRAANQPINQPNKQKLLHAQESQD